MPNMPWNKHSIIASIIHNLINVKFYQILLNVVNCVKYCYAKCARTQTLHTSYQTCSNVCLFLFGETKREEIENIDKIMKLLNSKFIRNQTQFQHFVWAVSMQPLEVFKFATNPCYQFTTEIWHKKRPENSIFYSKVSVCA